MHLRLLRPILLLPLCLAACGGGEDKTVKPVAEGGYNDYRGGDPNAGIIVGPSKDNKQQEAGATLGVNAYLWRGALDTLSFMPLASADPFGGVIITDWYSPPSATDERFKATAYILGRTLRADGVRVTIFRQVRQGGQWADAPVNPSTAADIENKVLARARELRAGQSR
ncbi:MAG TPA: DUF3576 domain-containing protein [Acetobacteraceae bacterium]|nr:DUF3576 domain-containing protein [Acetobacteraceae bacterium]